jgi:hypothetical protein
MSYLLVLGAAGAAGAFVLGVLGVLSSFAQPANRVPITRPNSTIKVYNRFIVCVTFTKTIKRTSKIFTRS